MSVMSVTPHIVMSPIGDDPPKATLYYGASALESLRALPDDSVNVVCTSPPYWGLRDYGTEPEVWGGDPECQHDWGNELYLPNPGRRDPQHRGKHRIEGDTKTDGEGRDTVYPKTMGSFCSQCGAWRGSLGLEPTPDLFVEHLVLIFRELRRVLHPTGTFWLNLGDSYMSHVAYDHTNLGGREGERKKDEEGYGDAIIIGKPNVEGLKDKDLVGVPWRAALALQADGWWLRNCIIWHKTNAMPSSVQDRFSCKYEYVFLFAKQARYFFDLDAVKVPHTYGSYDDEGNFTPSQNWLESGEGHRKMDQTEGQLGTLAGSPRRFGRGVYSPNGKNPGDIVLFPEEREDLRPLPIQSHDVTLGVEDFRDSADFIGRVVDQLEDTATRMWPNPSRTDFGQDGEAVSHIVEEFFRTRPVQPNLSVLRGTPYATVTVEQSSDEIRVEFGRCRWVLRREGLSGANPEKRQIRRHSFAVNGEGLDTMLVLVNWVPSLPLPPNVLNQLRVLRAEADGVGRATGQDATIGNHQTEGVRHPRSPSTEVAFVEGLLAVALHQARVTMTTPPGVVGFAETSGGAGLRAPFDGTGFHAPILPLETPQGKPLGDVWKIPHSPYRGAHFATWPKGLVERMILASTSSKGRCPACLTPWAGETPACDCGRHEPERCVVLDPFSGSATTGLMAMQHGRDYIGLDLNAEYLPLAEARLTGRAAPAAKKNDEPDLIGELFG